MESHVTPILTEVNEITALFIQFTETDDNENSVTIEHTHEVEKPYKRYPFWSKEDIDRQVKICLMEHNVVEKLAEKLQSKLEKKLNKLEGYEFPEVPLQEGGING